MRLTDGRWLRLVIWSALVFGSGTMAARLVAADARAATPYAGSALTMPIPLPPVQVLPSIDLPVPSVDSPLPSVDVPLPSIDVGTPLPSISPLPSLPVPSLPLPSVALPSVSLPLPSVASPTPAAQPTLAPARSSDERSGGVTPTNPASGSRPRSDDVFEGDASSASISGRGSGSNQRVLTLPSWLVPSLAFGVPLAFLMGFLLTQLSLGAGLLGVARRVLSRAPATPRWMRGASDVSDGT